MKQFKELSLAEQEKIEGGYWFSPITNFLANRLVWTVGKKAWTIQNTKSA